MASLITKVVRSGATEKGSSWSRSASHKTNPTNPATSRVVISGNPQSPQPSNTLWSKFGKDAPPLEGSTGSEIQLVSYPDQNGITKTVETTIVVDDLEDGRDK